MKASARVHRYGVCLLATLFISTASADGSNLPGKSANRLQRIVDRTGLATTLARSDVGLFEKKLLLEKYARKYKHVEWELYHSIRPAEHLLVIVEDACIGSDFALCNALGVLFRMGDIVEPDAPRAARLFAMACQGDLPEGCFHLAVMFANGEGVGLDETRALKYFTRSCKLGKPEGCKWVLEKGFTVDFPPSN